MTPETVHVVQIPTTILAGIFAIGTAQVGGMLAILWKGARWTSKIEGQLAAIRGSLDTHITREFDDLRSRVVRLEVEEE
jgi:hypothetical protein